MQSDNRHPYEELDSLLLAQSLGELTEADRKRLETLLQEDPDLRQRYLAYMQVEAQLRWRHSHAHKSDSLDPTSPTPPQPLSKRSTGGHGRQKFRWWAGTAACAVALLLASLWIWWPREGVKTPGSTTLIPGTSIAKHSVDKAIPARLVSRYATPIERAGWRIFPTNESDYEVDDHRFFLRNGEAYVASTNTEPVDRNFRVETLAGRVQANKTRYVVSTEPIQPLHKATLHEESEKADMNAKSTIGYRTRVFVLTGVVMLTNALGEVQGSTGEQLTATDRSVPKKLKAEGNYKEALAIYRKLVVDPAHGGAHGAADIEATVACLKKLDRQDNWDALSEAIVAAHPTDWRVLQAVVRGYAEIEKGGSIVKNQFHRSNRKGPYIQTRYHDCIRAMQLMQQALPQVAKEKNRKATFDFYKDFAQLFPTGVNAWRLHLLTDLEKLPDYKAMPNTSKIGKVTVEKGELPLFHHLPESWKAAKNDGQRWRWLLDQMIQADPHRADEARLMFADFLQMHIGVPTVTGRRMLTPEGKIFEGPNSTHTLADNETMIVQDKKPKRITLPDEFNFLRIYKEVAQSQPNGMHSPLKDVTYRVYRSKWKKLPDFDKLKPINHGKLSSGYLNTSAGTPTRRFGMVFTGTLKVPADGEYTISLDSDDGSRLRIGDDFVLDRDGIHGQGSPKTAKVRLTRGEHPVRIEFFQRDGDENLILFWKGPGIDGRQYWTCSQDFSPPETAMERLIQIRTNRMQLDRAATQLQELIEKFGPGRDVSHRRELEQIVKNWGKFGSNGPFFPGQPIKLDYVFRNGRHVDLTATQVDIDRLMVDFKNYMRSNPKLTSSYFNWLDEAQKYLISKHKEKYLAKKPAASWSVDIEPLPKHWDRTVPIEVPLEKVGVYLVEARMADGNTARTLVWLTDTMIVSSPAEKEILYTVVDAKTGKPISNAPVEIFGYTFKEIPEKERVENGSSYKAQTANFAETTDADGSVTTKIEQIEGSKKGPRWDQRFYWIAITRGAKNNRLGVFGVNYRTWDLENNNEAYPPSTTYILTDRSVYRPGQKVHFKAWVRAAHHDMAYVSHFAGKEFTVEIKNPNQDIIFSKKLKANQYGGIEDSFTLDKDAPLGNNYNIQINATPYVDPFTQKKEDTKYLGGSSFRVEEYKKPEFEVTVEAPREPIALGEKFEATVKAKYYFGQPVANAKVHYTVRRVPSTSSWYPHRTWDWLYGEGYWWYPRSYDWYPGWEIWGWASNSSYYASSPEVIEDKTVEIGPDGTLKIEIDTAAAKQNFPLIDHTYSITAEVTDESRRTITGSGSVIAACHPFEIRVWTDGEHYRTGETIEASFQTHRADGQPVVAKGTVTLYAITYGDDGKPHEKVAETWPIETDADGRATLKMKTPRSGQFRIAAELTNAKGQTQTGATIVTVTGDNQDEKHFRYDDLELLLDKTEYAPGDRVRLLINTKQPDSTVFLFVRPDQKTYPKPQVIQLHGRSTVHTIDITKADMPNFYIEAFTVVKGQLHQETRQIVVPPVRRVLNVAIEPSGDHYKPGEKAKVRIRLTDSEGKPVVGETALTVYDKSLDYIGGPHPAYPIRNQFWKWSRYHFAGHENSFSPRFSNLWMERERRMEEIDNYNRVVPWRNDPWWDNGWYGWGCGFMGGKNGEETVWFSTGCNADLDLYCYNPVPKKCKGGRDFENCNFAFFECDKNGSPARVVDIPYTICKPVYTTSDPAQPIVRKNFADLAYWAGSIVTDEDGTAEIEIPMPDNLTTWKIVAVSLTHGTVVGQGSTEVITTKDLLLRLQAPRFFVERDEVTLSANVHNYLEKPQDVQVGLALEGDVLTLAKDQPSKQTVQLAAATERRIDWRVRVNRPGQAVIRMSATAKEDSDAVEMAFPVYVHGTLKTDSYSATIAPDGKSAKITVNVPEKRRPEATHLEVRYSPSIALAMIDALPYLIGYEYDHTEATLSRFLPLIRTYKILTDLGVDIKAISEKETNLNPQEIGNAKERAAQWKIRQANPVFHQEQVDQLVQRGLRELARRQKENGGWSWYPEEKADAHTTAYVVHGLQTAKASGTPVVPDMLDRGVAWLEKYQKNETKKLLNNLTNPKKRPRKSHAEDLDALVAMVLADAGKPNQKMLDFLYRDRTKLSVYSLAMLGLTFDKLGQTERRDMCLRNVKQYLVTDKENQSAYLRLPEDRYWWCWYGSGTETHAYFLKLLARVEPKSETASGVAKYLLNNRRHNTWWYSTRDTALALEALADYLTASGEAKPDMTIELLVDGKKRKEIRITPQNLFTFDNVLHLRGDQLGTGKHTIEVRRKGTGPVYINAYMTNFTTEDFIKKAGLEVKVQRRYYKLVRDDQKIKVANSQSKPIDSTVEHYQRIPLKSGDRVKSGDLVDVELILDSKNDYEHLLIEDFKPAGFEPVEINSGYADGARMELRDEKVVFLLHWLPRDGRTIHYRLRAETPGTFSALPTKETGIYAAELRANSDEMKLQVTE